MVRFISFFVTVATVFLVCNFAFLPCVYSQAAPPQPGSVEKAYTDIDKDEEIEEEITTEKSRDEELIEDRRSESEKESSNSYGEICIIEK